MHWLEREPLGENGFFNHQKQGQGRARAEIDDGADRKWDVQRQKKNREAKFKYHFIMKRIIIIAVLAPDISSER